MEEKAMKYPIGVQNFQKLRERGNVYVDKTRFVWELTQQDSPIFLSRPRRFGKSLFISTLESYFLGKKELFEGLEISEYEKDWAVYPVLHLDLNVGEYDKKNSVRTVLKRFLVENKEKFGISGGDYDDLGLEFYSMVKDKHSLRFTH